MKAVNYWVIFLFLLIATIGTSQNLSVVASVTDLDCNIASGLPNGAVDLTVAGGAVPYTYVWSNGSLYQDQTGLYAGTYSVTVTDANGDTATDSYTLTEPTPVDVAEVLDQPDCNGFSGALDGGIDITAYGGTAPYTYNWTGPNTIATYEDQPGLGTGTYDVTITDDNGCSTVASYTLTEPTPVAVSEVLGQPHCNSSSGMPDGEIDITASGGMFGYTYNWTGPGVTASSEDQVGLGSGKYDLTVTDSNGCTVTAEYVLESLTAADYTITEIDDDCAAGGGVLEISCSNGAGPYVLSYTGGKFDQDELIIAGDSGTASFTGIEPGKQYEITITSANGCEQIFPFQSYSSHISILESPSLCLVTNELTTGNNVLLWEAPENADNFTKYHIYREGLSNGQFVLIGKIAAVAANRFVDTRVDPTVQAYKYQLRSADKCDNESEPSNIHKTVHLVTNQGIGGRINLSWDTYEGLDYDQVAIYRGTSPSDIVELVKLPSSNTSYTDKAPPAGIVYYQLVIPVRVECNINKAIYSVRSNMQIQNRLPLRRSLAFPSRYSPIPPMRYYT